MRKLIVALVAYSLVILIYASFLYYPVEPAVANHPSYHLVETKELKRFPSSEYRVYVRGSFHPAILVVSTVRTPYVPTSTYSRTLRYTESIAEKEVKERYGVDIDLVYVGVKNATIGNHTVVMEEYNVYLKGQGFLKPEVIKMDVGAFFCQEKLESVIVVYAYPPIFQSDFESVMGSIRC